MSAESRMWRVVARAVRSMVGLVRVQVASTAPLSVVGADGNVDVQSLGTYYPAVGEWVWLLRLPGASVVLGSATSASPPGARGVVTAYTSGSGSATVTVSGASYIVQHVGGYTPVVGHMVGISWTRTVDGWSGLIIGQQATASTTTPPAKQDIDDQTTPPKQTSGKLTIPAVQAGSWQFGRWRADTPHVIQSGYGGSNRNEGFWFYGSGFAAVPRGATIDTAAIRVKAVSSGSSAPVALRIAPHAAKSRSTGRPATGPVITGPAPQVTDGKIVTFTSPAFVALVQSIVDGDWAGVAVLSTTAADYKRLAGLTDTPGKKDRYALSGAVDLTWRL